MLRTLLVAAAAACLAVAPRLARTPLTLLLLLLLLFVHVCLQNVEGDWGHLAVDLAHANVRAARDRHLEHLFHPRHCVYVAHPHTFGVRMNADPATLFAIITRVLTGLSITAEEQELYAAFCTLAAANVYMDDSTLAGAIKVNADFKEKYKDSS